jgi:hypothetical protein
MTISHFRTNSGCLNRTKKMISPFLMTTLLRFSSSWIPYASSCRHCIVSEMVEKTWTSCLFTTFPGFGNRHQEIVFMKCFPREETSEIQEFPEFRDFRSVPSRNQPCFKDEIAFFYSRSVTCFNTAYCSVCQDSSTILHPVMVPSKSKDDFC